MSSNSSREKVEQAENHQNLTDLYNAYERIKEWSSIIALLISAETSLAIVYRQLF